MANITFSVPDDQIDRILKALNYDPNSGVTKQQFIKRYIRGQIMTQVINYESQIASDNAQKSTAEQINSDIVIT
jgi:hypothetical protein